jgi:hypothetical protein
MESKQESKSLSPTTTAAAADVTFAAPSTQQLPGSETPGVSKTAVPSAHWFVGANVEVSVQNSDKRWEWTHAVVTNIKKLSMEKKGEVQLHVIPSSSMPGGRVWIDTLDGRLAPIGTYFGHGAHGYSNDHTVGFKPTASSSSSADALGSTGSFSKSDGAGAGAGAAAAGEKV